MGSDTWDSDQQETHFYSSSSHLALVPCEDYSIGCSGGSDYLTTANLRHYLDLSNVWFVGN